MDLAGMTADDCFLASSTLLCALPAWGYPPSRPVCVLVLEGCSLAFLFTRERTVTSVFQLLWKQCWKTRVKFPLYNSLRQWGSGRVGVAYQSQPSLLKDHLGWSVDLWIRTQLTGTWKETCWVGSPYIKFGRGPRWETEKGTDRVCNGFANRGINCSCWGRRFPLSEGLSQREAAAH